MRQLFVSLIEVDVDHHDDNDDDDGSGGDISKHRSVCASVWIVCIMEVILIFYAG